MILKLLEAVSLNKKYELERGWFTRNARSVHAVNNLSLSLESGETLGLVGKVAVVRALWPDFCWDWRNPPPEELCTGTRIIRIGPLAKCA